MLDIEKRRQERFVLAHQPAGEIFLHTGEIRHPVSGIHDISDAGASVFLEQSIAVPQRVSIEFADAGMKLEVYGNATWCAAREGESGEIPGPEGYILGIELLSPLLLLSLLPKK